MASKLHPPEPRGGWLPRQRLTGRLASSGTKLVAVTAPAGFGKTIAVAQWRAAELGRRAFAWVTLDHGDDDPARLWWHVVTSLRKACPRLGDGEDPLRFLRAQVPDISGRLVPSLVNALAGLPDRAVLVLDDYHLLRQPRCHEQIELLLGNLPPSTTVVIIGRADPPLQLARLRAAGDLTEIGMSELRFAPGEAAALIHAVAGVRLTGLGLAELVDRTEGWPAALYLAALSLRARPDPGSFVRDFTGGNRYVADYLFEEVIGRQPGHVVRFLTRTAILDRFTAPLCDAVAGTADAAATIEVLERENLFLVALDENRRWFRYHHLFAQALRERLTAREPALVPVLHARAGEWFRLHGSPEEAMSHALAAGDTDGAVDAIAASWYPYLNSGRIATVRGWLTAIGDEAVQANPRAAHVAAWLAALSGDPATVRRLLPVIGSAADTGPLPDGMRSLRSSAVLLRATFGFEGIRVMRESAATAVKLEDDPASPWSTLAMAVYGFSLYLSGERGAGEPLRRAALSGVTDPGIRLATTSIAALIAADEGRLAESMALAETAVEIAEVNGMKDVPQASLAHLAIGVGWARQGRLEDARAELARALASRRRPLGMSPWPTIEIMFRLATVLDDTGDDAGAAAVVAEIEGQLASLPEGAQAQRARLERLRRRLSAERGAPPAQTLTSRETAILNMLRGPLSVAGIAQELAVSPNTVKTHVRAIYRKLGVCTRPAALSRGRDLGLFLVPRRETW